VASLAAFGLVRKPARTVERDVPPVPPVLVERMRVLMLARSTTTGVPMR
jgi:hypothetical protein